MSEFEQHPPGPFAIPTVIEQNGRGVHSYDIYSRLLKDRTVSIGSEIDDRVANLVVAQLLFLQTEDAQRDVNIRHRNMGSWIKLSSSGKTVCD